MLIGPELASSTPPTKLAIFLHGLGADGNDLIDLASYMQQALPPTHFISPHAPFACDMAPYGYQWFSLQNRDEEFILTGVKKAAPLLNEFIDAQLARFNLSDKDLILLGFSQGAMMSLYVSLRRKTPPAAVVAFSGALVGVESLDDELTAKPPIALIHGEQDDVVPFTCSALAYQALTDYDVPTILHKRPGLGHSIDPEGFNLAVKFLMEKVVND